MEKLKRVGAEAERVRSLLSGRGFLEIQKLFHHQRKVSRSVQTTKRIVHSAIQFVKAVVGALGDAVRPVHGRRDGGHCLFGDGKIRMRPGQDGGGDGGSECARLRRS